MKKTILTSLLMISIIGLGLPLAKASSSITEMRNKYNKGSESQKYEKDYIDHDQPYNDGSADEGTKVMTIITTTPCYTIMQDSISKNVVYAQGRIIEEKDEDGNYTVTKFYPSSFARKVNLGYNDGERNPNEFNDDLQEYLRTLIGNDYTIGLSLESFTSYLTFLQEDFGMYEDEADCWILEWKKYNNSWTDEEIEQMELKKKEEENKLKELEEARQKAIKAYEDAVKESSKNKKSLFEKEAIMIERSLPDYITFDKEKYVRARTSGMSYIEACEYSQTINKEKAWEEVKDLVNDNEDKVTELENDYNSSATIKDSVDTIVSKIKDFTKELFS